MRRDRHPKLCCYKNIGPVSLNETGALCVLCVVTTHMPSLRRLFGVLAVLIAFFAAEIDTRLTPRRVVTMATLWTIGISALFALVTGTNDALGTDQVHPGAGGPTPARFLSITLLALAATLYAHRGLTQRRWLVTWMSVMLFALALSESLRFLVESAGDLRLTGGAVLALLGLAFILVIGPPLVLAVVVRFSSALLPFTEAFAQAGFALFLAATFVAIGLAIGLYLVWLVERLQRTRAAQHTAGSKPPTTAPPAAPPAA